MSNRIVGGCVLHITQVHIRVRSSHYIYRRLRRHHGCALNTILYYTCACECVLLYVYKILYNINAMAVAQVPTRVDQRRIRMVYLYIYGSVKLYIYPT